ncbi:MAG TPA: beta-propeller domain-containing protein [Acidimicrobiales bacterium]|nr:beta-propeller domain-containing protein [Acidimicrobiales bacterium]
MIRRRPAALLVAGLLSLPVVAALPASAAPADDPTTTVRVPEGDPTFAAIDISQRRFPDGESPAHVVLSRDDSFADSVAGSGLTGDGPLLYTDPDELTTATATEIDRLLDAGDRVYLLGGTSALSDAVANALSAKGYALTRLSGATRVETALAVASEVRRLHPGEEVLLASADAWADSVSAGSVAAANDTPVLVTPGAELAPAVAYWLGADAPARTTLLGGTAALSDEIADAVPNDVRIAGTDRTGTAAAVATELWGEDGEGERTFVVSDGTDERGWAFGFAAAGLAADEEAPILLVTDEVTEPTADLVSTCGEPEVDLTVVGDGGVVEPALREQLDAADGLACGPDGSIVVEEELVPFDACAPLLETYRERALDQVGPYGLGGYGGFYPEDGEIVDVVEEDEGVANDGGADAPTTGDADDSAGQEGGGTTGIRADETSSTNVQEEGVDEPDLLKTDGDTAFIVSGSELHVVDITGSSPERIDTIDLDENASHELLLSGDRLAVLSQEHQFFAIEGDVRAASSFAPYGGSTTTVTYYDVSDPDDVDEVESVSFEGSSRSARMVGSVVRLVLQTEPTLPFTYPNESTPEAEHEAAQHNREVIEDATIEDWLPVYAEGDAEGELVVDCTDVRTPELSSGLSTLSVVTFDIAGGIEPTSSAAVVGTGETVYASRNRLYVTTGRWDWQQGALDSVVTTEVHGFDISDADETSYVASGSVPGYVLNQFSLSEHEGNLRIATTTEPPWNGDETTPSESQVTVLAERGGDLVEIGRVDGLGLDERIYAVRYFGDLAAVVTFRQVDPLFLIDLSDPTDPEVLGELKIPGYSAYLHPVGEDLLLGVGASADDEGMVTGAQVSLFDISDRSNPEQVDTLSFANGYSPVDHDHHAFLYWAATDLAVLPLETWSDTGSTFLGAVGIRVDGDELVEVGRATHTDDVNRDELWPSISRSFVDSGSLYTVSMQGIERNDLDDLRELDFERF